MLNWKIEKYNKKLKQNIFYVFDTSDFLSKLFY